eukprot:g13627.t1
MPSFQGASQAIIPPHVFKAHGWKLAHELKPTEYDKACGKNNNHYNGASTKKSLEFWERLQEDPKRPRAENLAPRSISLRWKIPPETSLFIWPEEAGHSAIQQRNSRWRVWMYYCSHFLPHMFWEPALITDVHQYEQLRKRHPNATWAHLQVFGHFLFDREIQNPQGYVSLVAQRLRSLAVLEQNNSGAAQLQQMTFNNLNSYRAQLTPEKAVPPNLDKLPSLNDREQKIFGMWSGTGLRKDSLASIRTDLAMLVLPQRKFVRCIIPSVKSIPEPGKSFEVYIPAPIFADEVSPVSTQELDILARKLGTTSHGVRRSLALFLRRRALEMNLLPSTKTVRDERCDAFVEKVNSFFAWSKGSVMWTEVYAKDASNFVNAAYMIHPFVDDYFAST